MNQTDNNNISSLVTVVPDFPKPGINFRNISPLLRDVKLRNWTVEQLYNHYITTIVDVVVGIDARGFIVGVLLANRLGLPFVMARKPSKLPGKIERADYALEYGNASLEMECDAIKPGQKILVIDDILATGGTLIAACTLVNKLGGIVIGTCCLVEIDGLGGYNKIQDQLKVPCFCLIRNIKSKLDTSLESLDCSSCPFNFIPPPNSSNKVVLLCHPSMNLLADNLNKYHGDIFTLKCIQWDSFPDGYPNIHFAKDLAGTRVVFLGSLFDKQSFMDQLSVMIVLPRQNILSLDIYLPYYAPGTMERVETPGTLATADSYAQIISCPFPSTQNGPPTLSIFDIHNSVTRFSFSNSLRFLPMSAVPKVLVEMKCLYDKNWAVAFPDEGSYKRFRGMLSKDQPMIVCGKVRDGNQRVVRIMDVSPSQLELKTLDHVVIIDDLIQTGGTMHECRLALQVAGVKNISAYCTHAVFPNRGYTNFMQGGKWEGFENFWITDSIPVHADLLRNCKPFKIISLVPLIADDICDKYYRHYNYI